MTQKNTIRTEVVGNDINRYLLKIEWNKTAPSALVIMLQASKTNGISFDINKFVQKKSYGSDMHPYSLNSLIFLPFEFAN